MNVGKSINICCAKSGIKKKDLALITGFTTKHITTLSNSTECSGKAIEKLSKAFDMKVSEFIAVGE